MCFNRYSIRFDDSSTIRSQYINILPFSFHCIFKCFFHITNRSAKKVKKSVKSGFFFSFSLPKMRYAAYHRPTAAYLVIFTFTSYGRGVYSMRTFLNDLNIHKIVLFYLIVFTYFPFFVHSSSMQPVGGLVSNWPWRDLNLRKCELLKGIINLVHLICTGVER